MWPGYFLEARGGYLGIFRWVCAAGDSKLAPRSKKNSPKIDTPFKKWANFLYSVLESFLLRLSPSPSGKLRTHSRLLRAYLSKMAESALAARAKIRPPCTLKHRVQQEYNSLLANALNRIFKSNLSLNNFKWLLTKPEFSCVRNTMPRSRKRL